MLQGKLKYVIYAVIAVVFIVVVFTAYRMFFMFNKKKIKEYIEAGANTSADPNTAYKVITEMVQSILKSQDETAAVKAMATAEKVDKEQKLVETAMFKCFALGFLENPQTIVAVEVSTPGVSAAQ